MLKIALVHDYLTQYGGAERVLEVLAGMFPEAPIYTLLYDEKATGRVFKKRDVRTSFLQKIPFSRRHHRWFPLLMPIAIEQFDLGEFDVVLSISHSFAKGIITKPHTKHINYCLTPPRFLWDDSHRYIGEFNLPWSVRKLLPFVLSYLRIWDKEASYRVDEYVAISQFVRARVKKYYEHDAQVIYPPVDTKKYFISERLDDYFLMVGRLVAYKRFDLAVKAFSVMGLPLKIVGDGPEYRKIKNQISNVKNIKLLGLVSDYKLPGIYAKAQAVIFPQEEDFGIVPLEAMASGRPVIAYRAGGALETIVNGETGIFFDQQTEIDICEAVGKFRRVSWDPQRIKEQAMKFDVALFIEKIKNLVY